MPIYEFECGSCGARFEILRSISDRESEVSCPECGGEHPLRVCSVFAPRYSDSQPTSWAPT